jgi:hypothetical protein
MKNTLTHKTAFLSWLAIYPIMNIVQHYQIDYINLILIILSMMYAFKFLALIFSIHLIVLR